MAKVYLNGCAGIDPLVDMNGEPISIGDQLSWDYGDPYYQKKGVDDWMLGPIFNVVEHKSGRGLCAKGINKDLYLHDFRFEFCKVNPH